MADPEVKPPAEARVKELEAERDKWQKDHEALRVSIIGMEMQIEGAHKVFDGAGVAWSMGLEAGRLPLPKRAALAVEPDTLTNTEREALMERAAKAEDALLKLRATKCLDAMDASAGIVVEPAALTRDYNAEVIAARIDALKTLGVNPYDPPVCIIGGAKKRAKTLEHAQKFEDELAQIWELWGAGRPQTPGCVLDAAQEMERTATALRVKLGAIAEKLNDEGFPTHYGEDERGGPIPLPDRVGMLLTLTDRLKAEALAWRTDAGEAQAELFAAHKELAELGSPRFAGGQLLTAAHRIRALPGLLRQE